MVSIKYLIGLLSWYKKPEPKRRVLKVQGPKTSRYQALAQKTLEQIVQQKPRVSFEGPVPEDLASISIAERDKRYRASLQLLQDTYRIKDPIVYRIAREFDTSDLGNIYSILKHTLGADAEYFIRRVPSAFLVFKKSKDKEQYHIDSYIKTLSRVQKLIYDKYNGKVPPEYDWRKTPSSFANLEELLKLEQKLNNLEYVPNNLEASDLLKNLEVYAGKRIIFLGISSPHKEESLKIYFPSSATLTFHRGDELKGLINQLGNYDVIVLCGGISSHNITQKLMSAYGQDYKRRVINAFDSVNPSRILETMVQYANRFSE